MRKYDMSDAIEIPVKVFKSFRIGCYLNSSTSTINECLETYWLDTEYPQIVLSDIDGIYFYSQCSIYTSFCKSLEVDEEC